MDRCPSGHSLIERDQVCFLSVHAIFMISYWCYDQIFKLLRTYLRSQIALGGGSYFVSALEALGSQTQPSIPTTQPSTDSFDWTLVAVIAGSILLTVGIAILVCVTVYFEHAVISILINSCSIEAVSVMPSCL